MSDEIKEILDRLDFNEWEIDLYKTPITWAELYDIRDYITNLQQENERLKEKLNCKEILKQGMPDNTEFVILTKANYDRQQKDIELELIDYKSRVEKAVEYIEVHTDKLKTTRVPQIDFSYKDLLNILQGSKDE